MNPQKKPKERCRNCNLIIEKSANGKWMHKNIRGGMSSSACFLAEPKDEKSKVKMIIFGKEAEFKKCLICGENVLCGKGEEPICNTHRNEKPKQKQDALLETDGNSPSSCPASGADLKPSSVLSSEKIAEIKGMCLGNAEIAIDLTQEAVLAKCRAEMDALRKDIAEAEQEIIETRQMILSVMIDYGLSNIEADRIFESEKNFELALKDVLEKHTAEKDTRIRTLEGEIQVVFPQMVVERDKAKERVKELEQERERMLSDAVFERIWKNCGDANTYEEAREAVRKILKGE